MEEVPRNVQDSDVLCYLQATMLVCYLSMDVGKGLKTPESETKGLISTHGKVKPGKHQFDCISSPCLKLTQEGCDGSRWMRYKRWNSIEAEKCSTKGLTPFEETTSIIIISEQFISPSPGTATEQLPTGFIYFAAYVTSYRNAYCQETDNPCNLHTQKECAGNSGLMVTIVKQNSKLIP